MLVVAFHAGLPGITGGYIGVDVFFVISGFLITGLLVDELEGTGSISFGSFYARRIRRLLPMAALVLVAVAVGMEFFTPPVFRPAVRFDALSAAFYYSNWQFAFEAVNYLTFGGAQNPVLHYWSLSVEEQFYLLWPFLLLGAVKLRRKGRPVGRVRLRCAVVVACVGGASLAYSIVETAAQPALAYFETTTRVWEFAAGATIALAASHLRRIPLLVAAPVGIAGLLMLAAAALVNAPTTEFPGTAALLPVLGASLVILAGARAPRHGAGVLLATRPLRYIGRISYAWYLWHWPCLVFARTARWAPANGRIGVTATVLAIALSLVLAIVTHALVEQPARRMAWFAVPRRRALLLGGSVTVAAVLALGITGGPFVLPGGTLDVIGNASAAVPAATTPLDAQASTAYPALHGCHVDYGATAPASGCVFGDAAARRTVVLIGDSHAAQWFPALERLATREHFRLVSWTKSGCPFALGVHIYLPALGRDYTECLAWQQHVLHDLRSQHPAMIIVGRTSTYLPQILTPDGDQASSTEAARIWGVGVVATVRALRPLASRVAVLRDTPHAPFDIPACISWDPGQTARCNFRFGQSGQLDGAEYAAERAAGVPASMYADPARVVCPGAVCQAEVGGIIVYRDDNHITAAFAASRWRQFAEALGNEQRRRPI